MAPEPMKARDSMQVFCNLVATEIEAWMDTHGWDRPTMLWVLRAMDPDVVHAEWEFATLVDGMVDDDDAALRAPIWSIGRTKILDISRTEQPGDERTERLIEPFVHGFTLSLEQVITEHPADALVGIRFEEEILGAVLSFEGWLHPQWCDDDLRNGVELPPPSTYPDRREGRFVHVVLRDGTAGCTQRIRGEAPQTHEHDLRIGGGVPAALRRTLGLPSQYWGAREPVDPHRLARRWWASITVAFTQAPIEALLEEGLPVDPAMITALSCVVPGRTATLGPLPQAALSALLPDQGGPGRIDATGEDAWELIRRRMRDLAAVRGEEEWVKTAEWIDAEMVAVYLNEVPGVEPLLESVTEGSHSHVTRVLSPAVVARIARYLDPTVPFLGMDEDFSDIDPGSVSEP